jgi:hypothetical protein
MVLCGHPPFAGHSALTEHAFFAVVAKEFCMPPAYFFARCPKH